ncbi:hypothetical protein, partial [Streptomyces sp. NPDC127574]|uniref:hypothetical protein n=1 Tax=Streptomyces sp. NPDC127574 TaxID=3345401 RepID=UPI00363689BC
MAGSARARIIALAGRRSWIVVDGRLPRSAAPYLSAVLRERCGQQAVVFPARRGRPHGRGDHGPRAQGT